MHVYFKYLILLFLISVSSLIAEEMNRYVAFGDTVVVVNERGLQPGLHGC